VKSQEGLMISDLLWAQGCQEWPWNPHIQAAQFLDNLNFPQP
jgi:hypothetical protein